MVLLLCFLVILSFVTVVIILSRDTLYLPNQRATSPIIERSLTTMSSNEACDDASKEALREQIALRNSYRRVLRVIYETIQEAKVEHLEPELCEEANITRRMLSLDDKSDHRPVFFDRYKGTFDDPKDPKDPPPWKYVPDEDRSRESLCLSWFFQHHTNHHWPEQAPGSWESG